MTGRLFPKVLDVLGNGAERPAAAVSLFDSLGAGEKELLWIEESNQRFYAYNHFGQHPERLLGWFDKHMSGTPTAGGVAKQVAQTV
jgi:hypothetical protein